MWLKLQQSRHRVAIAGQVTDAETKQSIAGAKVVLTQVPESLTKRLELQALQYGDRWETLSQRPDRASTGTDGYFHFIDLPAGNYQLTVSLPDAGSRYGTETAAATVSLEGDRPQPTMIAITLPPTALKGQIRDGHGEPIELAKIQLEGIREDALSDADGNYGMIGLEASSSNTTQRLVTVSAQGYDAQSNSITLSSGKTQILNFELQRKQTKAIGAANGKS